MIYHILRLSLFSWKAAVVSARRIAGIARACYLRQDGGPKVESITVRRGARVMTQKPLKFGIYLRQDGGLKVESITMRRGARVMTQKSLKFGVYLRQTRAAGSQSAVTGIDEDVLTHGESNRIRITWLPWKSAALKHAERTVMRGPSRTVAPSMRKGRLYFETAPMLSSVLFTALSSRIRAVCSTHRLQLASRLRKV